MKIIFVILINLVFLINLSSEEINPWSLKINERIINRKNISHIVIETRTDHYRLTFIVSDRFPYNYKSISYPLFIRLSNEVEAIALSKKFDKFLDTGYNVYFKLNGSEITSYRFD